MRKNYFENALVILWVQRLMDLHGGLVLLKVLPKTTNTVWYFHAQIKMMKYHVYNVVKNDEIMAINLEYNEKQ